MPNWMQHAAEVDQLIMLRVKSTRGHGQPDSHMQAAEPTVLRVKPDMAIRAARIRRTRALIKACLFMLVAIALLALAGAAPASAESASVKVFLNYMPNVTNYGPTSATAVALLNVGNGEITLDADGLPLVAGLAYEVWLSVSSEPVAMTSLGKFNPGANGVAHYHQIIEDLPFADYRYVMLTVESDPDMSPAPSQRRSIAGVIPDIAALAPTATPIPASQAATQPSGSQPSTSQPAGSQPTGAQQPVVNPAPPPVRLPTTGADRSTISNNGAWLLLAAIGLSASIYVLRRRLA